MREHKGQVAHYDGVCGNDSTNYYTFNYYRESLLVLGMLKDWSDKQILEIGCGEGRLAATMKFSGAARVEAINYSEEAIA